jgi:uncharacterized repeat protein (TIGR02543 family)
MNMRKLFFLLSITVLLSLTGCNGTFIDPGMFDTPGGGSGGGYLPPTPPEGTSSSLTFDINGGTGTTPARQSSASYYFTATLPGGNGFSKEGFYFTGWNTNAEGTGYTTYSAGASYTVIGTTTLYAKWAEGVAPTRTVTFDINGGTGTPPAQQLIPSNFSTTLPGGSGLSRDGYTFDGWNTSATGNGTNYAAGSTYYPSSTTVTLYAKWSYTGAGGEVNPIPLTANVWKDDEFTASSPSREIWYSFNVTAGTTYRLWLNDGYTTSGDGTKTLDVRVSASYSNGTAIFTGVDSAWSTAQSFTATSTTLVKVRVYPYNSNNNGTFALVYSTNETRPNTGSNYTVTFNANNGSGTGPEPMTGVDGATITLPEKGSLIRTGYEFGGWNTNTNGLGTNYLAGDSYTLAGNVTLYAKWNAVYIVTFNTNGGAGTAPASQPAVSGSSITLPSGEGLAKDGYIFGGWYTTTSTRAAYSAGASYTVNGAITLYAIWNTDLDGSGTDPDPFQLTEASWADGSITTSTNNREVWYTFSVTSGTPYYIWWNDSNAGNNTKTLDVRATAYLDNSPIPGFSAVDFAWSAPQSFTPTSDGTVRIRVYPYTTNNTGTFGIVYSETNTRPTP